jgi:uncharacterized protein YjbJ (UPF0337 family)
MAKNMDDLKGKVKEAAGDLTDNDELRHEGKLDQAAGTAKEKVGNAADKARDVVDKASEKAKDVLDR